MINMDNVNNKIVAKINLHGTLVLTSKDGQISDADVFIQSLKTQGLLSQTIAVVWVPTQLVLFTSVFVPGKRRADWLAALPFSLEESLSEPVENFHIVSLDRSKQGNVSAGLVEHSLMQKWIKVLENHGLEHVALIADCFSLPVAPQDSLQEKAVWSVYSDDQLRIVRKDKYSGFSSSPEWLVEIRDLTRQGKENQLPELHEIAQLYDSSIQTLNMLSGYNLRTGDYISVSEGSSILQRWKWHLVVLFLILTSFLTHTAIETQRLQTQTDNYQTETKTLFNNLFPDVKKIINIRVQTKNRINHIDRSVAIGPSQLMYEIESAFKLFPAVKIQKIQWDLKGSSIKGHQSGRLTIFVESLETQNLEDLNARLKSDEVSGKISLQIKNVTPVLVEGVFYVDAD
jgi:general secretion pathway protein L